MHALQCPAISYNALQCLVMPCNALQFLACPRMPCNALQCLAFPCKGLQYPTMDFNKSLEDSKHSFLHFGSLLALFFYVFPYDFLNAFLDDSFPTFGPKWFPERSDQKGLRRLRGAPGSQRRPKGLPKSNGPPRPFSNRMPDGGPDATPMLPGPSGAPFLMN